MTVTIKVANEVRDRLEGQAAVVGRAGRADEATLAAVRAWIADFLDL